MFIDDTQTEQEKIVDALRGPQFDRKLHGSLFDRGSADSYYGRGYNPHCYEGDTAMSPRIERDLMTKEDIQAYTAGYLFNEKSGDKKMWY